MRKLIALFFFLFSFSYGDGLILTEGKYSTYIQEEEFMVAEGENIIGPISILPTAVVDAVDVHADNLSITGFIIDKADLDWRRNLVGKFITIEGEGRIIRGVVVEIKGKFIALNSKKGYIVTTLPEFPSRISSHLKWEELFSPQLTLKVNSQEARSQVFKVRYPIKGIKWNISYILTEIDGIKLLKGFITIENSTSVDFRKIDISFENGFKTLKDVTLPPHTTKKLLFIKKRINSKEETKNLPSGKVFIYRNGVFQGSISIKKLFR
ncbi:hypothetical protein SAMN06265182_0500 [Persephonella hydrogeniphila]|uniref:Uncharacterized protein n=1 Tax=Persephonella hydrogeniphila TaxID=198703 RepID=A0A285N7E0_9AQUI|nr:hypothetical protein [Persephonella hydrogeniphila]SNZ03896.1 hypothetical protein SAMN06265182_0500 [Persephonella hydrogeniphila]